MNITFVCTGNTCRSPMAEGICRSIIKKRNIENFTCQSCGLMPFGGDSPSYNAVLTLADYGIDLSTHRSRSINSYIIDESDVIVCMTQMHKQAIENACPDKRIIVPEGGISDPYDGDLEVYKNCANILYKFIEVLIDTLTAVIMPMSESHIKMIAEIEALCFSSPWSENALAEELNNEASHFLCAVSNEKVLAYIGVHEICGEAYITNVAVHPDYRRMGLGQDLIKKASNDAESRGCEFISLEVRKSNVPAIELYKKEGYNTVGERKAFYSNPTEDALIMTKILKKDEHNENLGN